MFARLGFTPLSPSETLNSFQWAPQEIAGRTISLEEKATPERFRLVDCISYHIDGTIQIVECRSLESIRYATLSYPWDGNFVAVKDKSFAIEVAKDATPSDRIGLRVFEIACGACRSTGIRY